MLNVLIWVAVFSATSCFAQDPATVMLGGTGPTPHLQTVLDGVADLLSTSGVQVKISAGDAKSRTVLLDEMKSSGLKTLLYLTVNQVKGQRGKILAQSFVDGKQVWEEEVRGSLMAASAEGEVRKMVKAINEKLKPHIGGAGVPKE
jgi:hypothetical protein